MKYLESVTCITSGERSKSGVDLIKNYDKFYDQEINVLSVRTE